MKIAAVVSVWVAFLWALTAPMVTAQGVVSGDLLLRCRKAKRCGRRLRRGVLMHQGTVGTKSCQEKCVVVPFLARQWKCGGCHTVAAPVAAPMVPTPAIPVAPPSGFTPVAAPVTPPAPPSGSTPAATPVTSPAPAMAPVNRDPGAGLAPVRTPLAVDTPVVRDNPTQAQAPMTRDTVGSLAPVSAPSDSDGPMPPTTPGDVPTPTTQGMAPSVLVPRDSPVDAPVNRDPGPNPAPGIAPSTLLNTSVCDLNRTIVVFVGHNRVESTTRGTINATWHPAFVYDRTDTRLVWCGNFSYHVIVVPGEFDASGTNKTGKKLYELAKELDVRATMYETTNTWWMRSDFIPGESYSVLVTAQTQNGHVSLNRAPAKVEISTTDPKMKSDFTRLVIIPDPTDMFQVEAKNDTVFFIGRHPSEVIGLEEKDYVFFFDSKGNATLGRCLRSVKTALVHSWEYIPSDLSDLFDEMDISADIASSEIGARGRSPLDPGRVAQIELEIASLDPNIEEQLCRMAFPNRGTFDCFSQTNGRRLGFLDKLIDTYNSIMAFAELISTTIKDISTLIDLLDFDFTIDESFNFFSIDEGLSQKCRADPEPDIPLGVEMEYGIKFTSSAGAQVKMTVTQGTSRASIDITGFLQAKTFLYVRLFGEFKNEPDPWNLFATTQLFFIPVGPVLIPIVNRQSIEGFVNVVAAVESQFLVELALGYDFIFSFSFDSERSKPFESSSLWTRRKVPVKEPEVDASLSVTAEAGVILVWDTFVFIVFQATAVADLGVRLDVVVGMTEKSIVITPPYWLVLDSFRVSAFARVRALLGVKNDKSELLPGSSPPKNEFCGNLTRKYSVPNFTPRSFDRNEALQQARDGIVKRTQKLDGLDLEFGKEYLIYSGEYWLAGIPEISIKDKSAATCVLGDAIAQTFEIEVKKAPIDIRNDVKDGVWFTDFDGKVDSKEEDTGWVVSGSKTDLNSFTIRLPRSVSTRSNFSGFRVYPGAAVYVRVTPEVFPFPPKSMFAKLVIPEVNLDCCEESDCRGSMDQCVDGRCTPPTIPTPPTPQVPSNYSYAGAIGDPHICTFDRHWYDCQARGEFILFRAEPMGSLVHALFDSDTSLVSFTTGVAARGDSSSTLVQVSIPRNGTDPFHIYADGMRLPNPFDGYQDTTVTVSVEDNRNVVTLFFNVPQLVVKIKYYAFRFPFLSVTLGIPTSFQNQTVRGLFGTPDNNKTNDLMSPDGSVLSIANAGTVHDSIGYKYCTSWCVANKSNSVYSYDHTRGFDFHQRCNNSFPGSVDISTASEVLRDLCGGSIACLIDGTVLGIEGAQSFLLDEADLLSRKQPSRLPTSRPSMRPVTQPFPVPMPMPLPMPLPIPIPSAVDGTPPRLINLTALSPTVVNFSSGSGIVSFKLTVQDDDSGFYSATIEMSSNGGRSVDCWAPARIVREPFECTLALNVNHRVPHGNYTISLSLYDRRGNINRVTQNQLASMSFPSVVEIVDIPEPILNVGINSLSPTRITIVDSTIDHSVLFELTFEANRIAEIYGHVRLQNRTETAQVYVNARFRQSFRSQARMILLSGIPSGTYDLLIEIFVTGYSTPFVFTPNMITSKNVSSIDVVNWNDIDKSPPRLINVILLSPPTVNVTTAASTVELQVVVKDDATGLFFWRLTAFCGKDGRILSTSTTFSESVFLVDGPPLNQSKPYNCSLVFPKGERQTDCRLEVYLADHTRKGATYRYPFANSTVPYAIQVVNALDRTVPPEVLNFALSTTAVNVTHRPVNVTVNVSVRDVLPGVSTVSVCAYALINWRFPPSLCDSFMLTVPVAQDIVNVSLTFAFPRGVYPNQYDVWLEVRDMDGYTTQLTADALSTRNWPSTFALYNNIADTTPPRIINWTIAPRTVNISAGPVTVTILLRIADDMSGIQSDAGYINFGFAGIGSGFHFPLKLETSTKVSEGLYNLTMWLGPGWTPGVHSLLEIRLQDNVGNSKLYNERDLVALGFPHNITIVK